jgi:hypothetical protein
VTIMRYALAAHPATEPSRRRVAETFLRPVPPNTVAQVPQVSEIAGKVSMIAAKQ